MTVTDSNEYIHYTDMEYKSTLETIREKLIDTHGGYLRIRYTEAGKLLDYLSDYNGPQESDHGLEKEREHCFRRKGYAVPRLDSQKL